jgi:hypothetical protein
MVAVMQHDDTKCIVDDLHVGAGLIAALTGAAVGFAVVRVAVAQKYSTSQIR